MVETKIIILDQQEIVYKIHYKRIKNCYLRVEKGEVVISCSPLFPQSEIEKLIRNHQEEILEQMGLQIKYARLRRKLSAELVAERAGISRATLVSIEKGASSVAIGYYAAVLHALNYMDKDLLLVAKDDELGRKLQDLDLPVRKRVTKKG